jgi:aminopeptidase-like protein
LADEILFVCHSCHPSLCNDNLSGISVITHLAQELTSRRRRHSCRFLFVPGTIGSITWLCLNEARCGRIKHGLIAACLGDGGCSTYKRSRRGNADIDRAVTHVLTHSESEYQVTDFIPYGYDERQFCSPGFNLPVGCLMRTPHGQFPEYHTSADNLDLVRPEALADSYEKFARVITLLEENRRYINLNPKCEPQLGKRGLYGSTGGGSVPELQMALLWVLNFSDGEHSLLDIAERAGMKFDVISSAADALVRGGLLAEAPDEVGDNLPSAPCHRSSTAAGPCGV